MFGVRIVIKLMIFIIYVFKYIHFNDAYNVLYKGDAGIIF